MADHPGSFNNPTPEQLERWGPDPDNYVDEAADLYAEADALHDREERGYYDEEVYPRG